MTVLAVKGLTYSFGKQTVLDNISFTLEKGDIAGLIGNNGAGKRTLMKLVSGILAGPKDIIDLKTRYEILEKIKKLPTYGSLFIKDGTQ